MLSAKRQQAKTFLINILAIMEISEILKRLGFNSNEAELYHLLLKFGPLPAKDLSKLSGIYRPSVYDNLNTLSSKGLLSKISENGRTKFSAANSKNLLSLLKEREKQAKSDFLLFKNELKNSNKSIIKKDTFAEILHGKEGLKSFLRDIINNVKKEVLIFGLDDRYYQDQLPIFMPQYFKKLKELKIKERVVAVKKTFQFKNEITQYRFLNTNQSLISNTFVYGNKLALVMWGTPITIVIVTNQNLVKTYKEHFEYLWNLAK